MDSDNWYAVTVAAFLAIFFGVLAIPEQDVAYAQKIAFDAIFLGVYFVSSIVYFGFLRKHWMKTAKKPVKVEQVKQDVFDNPQHPEEDPKAYYVFTFTSEDAFTANYPIHVSIKLWITKGQEALLPLTFVFPEALAYPRRMKTGRPPEAPYITVSFSQKDGAYVGEGDMEFTRAGQFGYIIFSKEQPVFYAGTKQIINISPVEVRTQKPHSDA